MIKGVFSSFINPYLSRKNRYESAGMPWLEESYRDPSGFWSALKNKRDSFFNLPGKSNPFVSYNFFHDIILCNKNKETPAFRWYESSSGWQAMSYAALGIMSARKAESFMNAGVKQGDRLCIISPLNNDFLVNLLAGLKIGTLISILPPLGERFLLKRIEAFAPDHIACEEKYETLIPPWKDKIISGKNASENSNIENSHSYATGTKIFAAFNPSDPMPHVPVDITADTAYLNAMREGIIALGLKPGKSAAAPGFDFLETQPGMIIAVLLCGGTFVHMEPDDIRKNTGLLTKYELENIGITTEVRDSISANPVAIENSWKCWYRNPSESMNPVSWQAFIEVADIKKDCPVMNLKWDAALCGCSFFSPKIAGEVHFEVLASAGCPWQIADMSGNITDINEGFGLFSLLLPGAEPDDFFLTSNMVSDYNGKLMFSGNNIAGKFGRFFPVDEIIDTVTKIPGCFLCSAHKAVSSSNPVCYHFTLIIFTGSDRDIDEASYIKRIKETIVQEYSDFYLMDKYVFYPLMPRFTDDNAIDHEWCSSQYAHGSLIKKSGAELYHSLTVLKECVYS